MNQNFSPPQKKLKKKPQVFKNLPETSAFCPPTKCQFCHTSLCQKCQESRRQPATFTSCSMQREINPIVPKEKKGGIATINWRSSLRSSVYEVFTTYFQPALLVAIPNLYVSGEETDARVVKVLSSRSHNE